MSTKHRESAYNINLFKEAVAALFPTPHDPLASQKDPANESDSENSQGECDLGSDCEGGQDCPEWVDFVDLITGLMLAEKVQDIDASSTWVCSECGNIVTKLFLTYFPNGDKWLEEVLNFDLLDSCCHCKRPQVTAIPIMTPPAGSAVLPVPVETDTVSSLRKSKSRAKSSKSPKDSKESPAVPKSSRGVAKGSHGKYSLRIKKGVFVCGKCKQSPTKSGNSCSYCKDLYQGLLLPYGRSYHSLQSRNKQDTSDASISAKCLTCKKQFSARGTWQKWCLPCYTKNQSK